MRNPASVPKTSLESANSTTTHESITQLTYDPDLTMSKEKTEKKEKKEKKEKRSEIDGVTKKSKKDKKEKKEKSAEQVEAMLEQAEVVKAVKPKKEKKEEKQDVEIEDRAMTVIPKEALVPFCNPLADDKQARKVLKSVRKGMFSS
jgi:H/ACA ribonucleoprotein complex subunit 2